MSKKDCGRYATWTIKDKVFTCAGENYYRSADGELLFGKGGKEAYERDNMTKAALAAGVGVVAVYFLTR